jgi:hypothetical protein
MKINRTPPGRRSRQIQFQPAAPSSAADGEAMSKNVKGQPHGPPSQPNPQPLPGKLKDYVDVQ